MTISSGGWVSFRTFLKNKEPILAGEKIPSAPKTPSLNLPRINQDQLHFSFDANHSVPHLELMDIPSQPRMVSPTNFTLHADIANKKFKVVPAPRNQILQGIQNKCVLKDETGKLWLFKQFNDHVSNEMELLPQASVAASQILQALKVPTPPVYLSRQVIGGKTLTGTLQPFINDAKALPSKPTQMTQKQLDDLLVSHIARRLLADPDGHQGNFIVEAKKGNALTVDCGMIYGLGFSDDLYSGIYRSVYSDYTKGLINLDFKKGHDLLNRISKMSDIDFATMLKPFAEAHYRQFGPIGAARDVNVFLQNAIARKHRIVPEIKAMYKTLQETRQNQHPQINR